METRLLEYFVAAAAESNITRAARQVYAAQSTVSAGIRSLENELGVDLFERVGKTIRLTPAGAALVPEAQAVLDGAERMRIVGDETGRGRRGRLRVGTFIAMESFADLPGAVRELRADFPHVDLSLVASVRGSTGLADDLEHGRLDVAFFALPVSAGLETVELARFPYIALLPRKHPLAGRAAVTLRQLADSPWVDVLPGYGNRVQVEQALAERGLTRTVTAEVAALPSVRQYVAAGFGVSVVPAMGETAGCAVVPISDPLPEWTISLATRRGGLTRPPVARLVELLRARASLIR